MRLRQVQAEYEGQVRFQWKSYLLRPEPKGERNLEKFKAYTRSWLRPAGEPDSGDFNVWSTDERPPSHSVPPHRAAKAAARLGEDAFEAIHERLMRAYFTENRDISDWSTLEALWAEVGLEAGAFEVARGREVLAEIMTENQEARELGATGVPAVRLEGNNAIIVGAHPIELYRRWIDRTLEREARAEDS